MTNRLLTILASITFQLIPLFASFCQAADAPAPATVLGGQSPIRAGSVLDMARALQNPLSSLSALMTDNDIGFGLGEGEAGYSFQFQPVHAFEFTDAGFTVVLRGVIPVIGVPGEAKVPHLGTQRPARDHLTWGISDVMTQFFYTPHSDAEWKWGIGPQISWKTRTDDFVGGPGWGAGIAGIITGPITENIAFSGIIGNHWGNDGKFNIMAINPSLFYNIPSLPGTYIAYTATIGADWQAPSGDTWTVPLGAVIGRTFDMGGGHGIDVNVGAYSYVVKPDGGPDWSLKLGVSLLFGN